MCGVAGYIGKSTDAAAHVVRMQIELEGRGPHSAGVAVFVPGVGVLGQNRLGSASHLAQRIDLSRYLGPAAVGHNRYATAGSLADTQPLIGEINGQQIALGVNGDTVNICGQPVASYRRTLRTVYRARSDTETLLHLVAQMPPDDVVVMLAKAFTLVEGAWSLAALIGDGRLVAMRDPWGFRPLWLGQSADGYAVASEDCAFAADTTALREVAPGELVCILPDLAVHTSQYRPAAERLYRCAFEDVYFKNPGSRGVFTFRTACGYTLAAEMIAAGVDPTRFDGVVPMLDSGREAANALAHAMRLPVVCGINRTRLRQDTRAFLGHSEFERLQLAAQKHIVNREAMAGKRIILVDDSIVRGDTSGVVIKLLRGIGVAEVHMAIASPRIIGPCYYGIATPSREKLEAANRTLEATRIKLGADSLSHLSVAGFQANYQHLAIAGFRDHCRAGRDVCDACMTGQYPPFVPSSHCE